MQQQPQWLARAWAELGQQERMGSADNPAILAYYRDAGHSVVAHDETAWCAAFVGAMLARSGLPRSGSLMARSYAAHGTVIEEPRLGAIAVLTRGEDPALGHVGFVVGATDASLVLLGGNQSDSVSVAAFERSRLTALRWPEVKQAMTGTAPAVDDASGFDTALAHVLEMEGGWTDDPVDPGGPTNQGITIAVYAHHRGIALESRTRNQLLAELQAIAPATVREIYLSRYWRPCRAAELPAGLALMHFDAAVNHGVTGSAQILQQAIGTDVDGEIGPLTLAAARAATETAAIAAYAGHRRIRYRALPHFWRFGRGWLNRVAASERVSLRLAARQAAAAPDDPTASPREGETTMTDPASSFPSSEPSPPATELPTKWWGESLTIWGVIVTTLATVLPVIGPLVGLDVTVELVHQIGQQATQVIQALGGLVGTLMTITGRARATVSLVRRDLVVRVGVSNRASPPPPRPDMFMSGSVRHRYFRAALPDVDCRIT